MITIKKGDITIEVSQDCDVTVDGDLVKVAPSSSRQDVSDRDANAVCDEVGESLIRLREPGTATLCCYDCGIASLRNDGYARNRNGEISPIGYSLRVGHDFLCARCASVAVGRWNDRQKRSA
jgi:hypothetical protein